MIEPKTVAVIEQNVIEDGWRIVSPTEFSTYKNRFYKAPDLADIRKAVTFAKAIKIVLREPVLAGSVLNELKWVSQYAPIRIVAKDKSVVDRYSSIRFAEVSIDPDTDGNLLYIEGQRNRLILIDETYLEIHETLSLDGASFPRVKRVYVFGKHSLHEELKNAFANSADSINWVVAATDFSLSVVKRAASEKMNLFVAESVTPGVVLESLDGELFRLVPTDKENWGLTAIERLYSYCTGVYSVQVTENPVPCADVSYNSYYCDSKSIVPLNLDEKLVIERSVDVPLMEDFLETRFDSSLTEKHNDYSLRAKTVEYRFTLNPPTGNRDAKPSRLYEPIIRLMEEWDSQTCINHREAKDNFTKIYDNHGSLFGFLNSLQKESKSLHAIVSSFEYEGYYDVLAHIIKLLTNSNETIIQGLLEAHMAIASATSGTRFFKFDTEIEGYRATIAEKTTLIKQGEDVLSNKRRIDILNKKIEDLLKMKERFLQSSSQTEERSAEAFKKECLALLEGGNSSPRTQGSESIERVLSSNKDSAAAKLNMYVKTYLPKMKLCFDGLLRIAKDLSQISVPTRGIVVDSGDQMCLLIDSEEDFYLTSEIRNRLGLVCLARINK